MGTRPGRDTAGRDRITITAAKGDPVPIPPELLGAWWRAAEKAPSQVASDYYRFQLLTGCRGVEIHGHKLHKYPPIRVVERRAAIFWSQHYDVAIQYFGHAEQWDRIDRSLTSVSGARRRCALAAQPVPRIGELLPQPRSPTRG